MKSSVKLMVAVASFGFIGGTLLVVKAAVTKPDVRWNKKSEPPQYDKHKVVDVNQEYKDIGPYKG